MSDPFNGPLEGLDPKEVGALDIRQIQIERAITKWCLTHESEIIGI